MSLVSFTLKNITAKRMKATGGKMSINNNIKLTNVEEHDMTLPADRQALRLTYEYTTHYNPEIAEIIIEGEAYLILEEEDAKEYIKQWKKEKQLPLEAKLEILNNILQKMTVESINLADKLNLPPPIPLPKYQKKD